MAPSLPVACPARPCGKKHVITTQRYLQDELGGINVSCSHKISECSVSTMNSLAPAFSMQSQSLCESNTHIHTHTHACRPTHPPTQLVNGFNNIMSTSCIGCGLNCSVPVSWYSSSLHYNVHKEKLLSQCTLFFSTHQEKKSQAYSK